MRRQETAAMRGKLALTLIVAGIALHAIGCAPTSPSTPVASPPPAAAYTAPAVDLFSPDARDRYSYPNRDEWQHPQEVMRLLALKPGEQAADVGCGFGYFTFRMAREVGDSGRVYALDIDAEALAVVKEKAANVKNVVVMKSTGSEVPLPPKSLDAALLCDVAHGILFTGLSETESPGTDLDRLAKENGLSDFIAKIHAALKPGGRLVVLDRDRDPNFRAFPRSFMRKLVQAQHFQSSAEADFPLHYGIVFVSR